MKLPDDNFLTEYIFQSHKPVQADVIMMFGTRIKSGIEITYQLWKEKYAPMIIVSGGRNKVTHDIEADLISRDLINRGVPHEAIWLEEESTNTKENVIYTKYFFDSLNYLSKIKKILLVVKNYHSRRCLMTCRRWFPAHIEFFAIPYASYSFTKENWHNNPDGRREVEKEYKKIQKYLRQGDLRELE